MSEGLSHGYKDEVTPLAGFGNYLLIHNFGLIQRKNSLLCDSFGIEYKERDY